MYQTSNIALKLAMEAQRQELKGARSESNQDSTHDELKEFDKKAQEYEQSVKEAKLELPGTEERKEANWFV